MKYIINFFLFVIFILIVGFFYFIHLINNEKIQNLKSTEAIVILTGANGRVDAGLKLFCKNPSQKLFITGVGNNRSIENLLMQSCNLSEKRIKLVKNNIYIDRNAQSTISNAIETRNWIEKYKIKSIMVVTSDFHIPRVRSEFNYVIKGVNIEFYPYHSDIININKWWEIDTIRILFLEYYKYFLHVINRLNYIYG